MRLVDADALHTLLIKTKSIGELSAKKAIRYVEDAPTVDAVPVIRCKDCKYYRDGDCWHERENDRWIYYQSVINEPNPDDYCSLAEPKEKP